MIKIKKKITLVLLLGVITFAAVGTIVVSEIGNGQPQKIPTYGHSVSSVGENDGPHLNPLCAGPHCDNG